jgi:hypothetical protein
MWKGGWMEKVSGYGLKSDGSKFILNMWHWIINK